MLRNDVNEWQKIHGFCTNNVEEKVWRVEIHLLCTEESNHVVHFCSQTLISTHLLTHFYLLKNTHMTCVHQQLTNSSNVSCIPAILHLRKICQLRIYIKRLDLWFIPMWDNEFYFKRLTTLLISRNLTCTIYFKK